MQHPIFRVSKRRQAHSSTGSGKRTAYPFRLPQFLISFYRNVGKDLKHRKFYDTNEYDTVTVEEATRLALAEPKNRL